MASNLDYAEDIEEAKAYMAKKNVFQLFEVSNSAHFELIFFADAKMRSYTVATIVNQRQILFKKDLLHRCNQ